MDLLFLVNPDAGTGFWYKRFMRDMEPMCRKSRMKCIFKGSLDATDVGRDTVLVICGGDGTVSSVVKGMIEKQVRLPLAIVPQGTGNDIACALGWYEIWKDWGPWGLITAIKSSRCKGLDVWELSQCVSRKSSYTFVGYLGIGMDAAILEIYERLAKGLRHLTFFKAQKKWYYIVAGFFYLLSYPFRRPGWGSKLKAKASREDGATKFIIGGGSCLLFSNMNSYLGGVRLMDSVSFDDGRLDVFSWETWLKFIAFAMRGYLFKEATGTSPRFYRGTANSFHLELEGSCSFQIDGEFMGTLCPGSYEIKLSASVPVLIPPHDLLNPEHAIRTNPWKDVKRVEKALIPEPTFC